MKRFDAVVTRAADQIRAQLARIDERFPSEEPVITREEALKEMEERGHMYAEDCPSDFCQKVREMFAEGERALVGGV